MEWTTESVRATIDARYPKSGDLDREWDARANRGWWPRRTHRGTSARVSSRARHAA